MNTIAGQHRVDTAAFSCNSKYVLAWPRLVVSNSTSSTGGSASVCCSSSSFPSAAHAIALSLRTGQRVAMAFVGGILSSVVDVSVSPDGSLVACIGLDRKGAPCVVVGEEGISAAVRTSHALSRVLVLDSHHVVVVDANDQAHLFVLIEGEEGAERGVACSTELRAVHALSIEAVVDWVCVHVPTANTAPSSSSKEKYSPTLYIVAVVRNSHLMVLRLDRGTRHNETAALPSLKRCAYSQAMIPTPQKLSAAALAGSPSTPNAFTIWLASGRESCAVRMTVGAGDSSSSSSVSLSMELVEGSRVAIPDGSTTREVLSITALSDSVAHVLVRPATKEGAAHTASDNAEEGDASDSSVVNLALAEAVTVAFPLSKNAGPSASSAEPPLPLSHSTSIVSRKFLRTTHGQGILSGGFFNGKFVGLVAVPRVRSVALVPLVPTSSSEYPHPHLLLDSPGGSNMNDKALFQRRMERAKAELSALTHAVPSTEEESRGHIAAILRLQDEGRALQRTIEGVVTSNSAPKALLDQLYFVFTRATLRHLFLRTGTSLTAPIDLRSSQRVFEERLGCLRSITIETFCGLPGSLDASLEKERWAPTLPIFTTLMQTRGGLAAAAGTNTVIDTSESSSSSSPRELLLLFPEAGNAIINLCGNQLTPDVAVAALYVVIANKSVPIRDLAPIAGTLLRSAGLSPSLFHWALLMYMADSEADAQDLSATYSHLLSLDTSYDFGMVVMPRIIDALVCAGNVEAVYLMAPMLLQKAQFLLSDRVAIRVLLVAMIKGNAGLLSALLAIARNRRAPWRAVALHVAAVACASMGTSHLLEGAVVTASSARTEIGAVSVFPTLTGDSAMVMPSTSVDVAEEESIVETALRAVGTRVAHRVYIEFLVMQKRYAEALHMCEVFPAGSDKEHQAVTALAATIRCLVPNTERRSERRPYAFTGFFNPDTPQVLASVSTTRSIDSLRVNTEEIDAIASSVVGGQSFGLGARK